MNRQKTDNPTASTSEQLSSELCALAAKMKIVAWRIHYYGGLSAEALMRSRELSGAADMVYKWAREVKKEGKK